MKKVLLLSLFIASVAFADPSIGQNTVMEGTINGTPVTLERTVTQNMGDGTWLVEVKTTIAGQTSTKMDKERLLTSAEIGELMAKCTETGGRAEAVTVKAGTFDSCVFETPNMKFALADVPMSSVMLQYQNSNGTLVLELSSFKK